MFESAAVQAVRLQLISDGECNTKVASNIKILAIREATTKTLVDKLMQLIQVVDYPYSSRGKANLYHFTVCCGPIYTGISARIIFQCWICFIGFNGLSYDT